MIPPSIVLIIYGLTTETSITMLFQEAIVPGLMISGLIITYIPVSYTHLTLPTTPYV